MEKTGEETQRLKRVAAAAYDYDNDSRWADYWSNILIPPNLVSRPDVVHHFKSKFYQRFIDPDLVVETMSSSNSSIQQARQSAPSPPTNDQTQAQSLGASTPTDSNSKSARWVWHMVLFAVNALVLLVVLFAMIPMVPKNISRWTYRLSLVGSACSSLLSLFLKCGTPRSFDMEDLEVCFQAVVTTKDLVYLIYSVTFVASNLCLKFALIPIICVTIEPIAKFIRRNFSRSVFYSLSYFILTAGGYGNFEDCLGRETSLSNVLPVKCLEQPCAWVESNTTTLSLLSSNVEIALGFLLIISLFTWQRNFVQTFMYWQLLKVMYHFPMTAGYHQSAWAKIGRKVDPFVSCRFLPFLKPLLSAAQRWWSR